MKIKFSFENGITIVGELTEKKNPRTTKAIIDSLPVESIVNRWGNEIYFEIPVDVSLENSQEFVEVGDIAYWPPGKALCLFFGKTPVSIDNRPKAYSPVNVIGRIIEGTNVLKRVKDGEKVKLKR
ncbi:MAG: cyclophilin-like fold protein [Candidatus Asgardarchaeia archaeon]